MERGRQKEHCNEAKSKWGGPQPKREGPQPRFMSHQKTKVPYDMKKGETKMKINCSSPEQFAKAKDGQHSQEESETVNENKNRNKRDHTNTK